MGTSREDDKEDEHKERENAGWVGLIYSHLRRFQRRRTVKIIPGRSSVVGRKRDEFAEVHEQ